jgi:lipopolysaccharide/colanic/teichoic acid biosynthesis glycosyltransferase
MARSRAPHALASLIYRGTRNYGSVDTLSRTARDRSPSTTGGIALTVNSAAQQAEDLQAEAREFTRGKVVFRRMQKGSGVMLKLLFSRGKPTNRTPVAREQDTPMRQQPVEPQRPAAPLGAVLPGRLHNHRNPVALAPPSGCYGAVKRAADLAGAVALLVLTAPLMLLAMLLIKLTSRGPMLYRQIRVGHGGRPFTIYKLRTMVHGCESVTGARWAIPGDPRITEVGRLLRRSHLDELPQLWNVLRGDMTLVGPRPERPEFVPQLEQAVPHYRERLLVRPGVTGLAQVQLPPDTDFESVRVKLAYDLHYAAHRGFWLDLRIALATALKMVGVPFGLLQTLFRFPARAAIENTSRAPEPVARPPAARVQTA